jgi:hypothetical protein
LNVQTFIYIVFNTVRYPSGYSEVDTLYGCYLLGSVSKLLVRINWSLFIQINRLWDYGGDWKWFAWFNQIISQNKSTSDTSLVETLTVQVTGCKQ